MSLSWKLALQVRGDGVGPALLASHDLERRAAAQRLATWALQLAEAIERTAVEGATATGAAAGTSPVSSRAKSGGSTSPAKERALAVKGAKSPSKSRGSLTRRVSASVSDLVSSKQ
jgi:hypothetical protein